MRLSSFTPHSPRLHVLKPKHVLVSFYVPIRTVPSRLRLKFLFERSLI
jgi:hypothetical protein